MPIEEFLFLVVYYQCDVASYTKDVEVFHIWSICFNIKMEKRYIAKKVKLLNFKSFYDTRYKILNDEIQKCNNSISLPDKKVQKNLSTQDINIKVVDRIDLTKFERTKNER